MIAYGDEETYYEDDNQHESFHLGECYYEIMSVKWEESVSFLWYGSRRNQSLQCIFDGILSFLLDFLQSLSELIAKIITISSIIALNLCISDMYSFGYEKSS